MKKKSSRNTHLQAFHMSNTEFKMGIGFQLIRYSSRSCENEFPFTKVSLPQLLLRLIIQMICQAHVLYYQLSPFHFLILCSLLSYTDSLDYIEVTSLSLCSGLLQMPQDIFSVLPKIKTFLNGKNLHVFKLLRTYGMYENGTFRSILKADA